MTFVRELIEDILAPLAVSFGLIVIVMLLLVGGINFLVGKECLAKGRVMGLEVQYSFFEGCMVNLNGQYIPGDEVIAVERDGKIVFTAKPHIRLSTGEAKQ
jgi:hypothetical protein